MRLQNLLGTQLENLLQLPDLRHHLQKEYLILLGIQHLQWEVLILSERKLNLYEQKAPKLDFLIDEPKEEVKKKWMLAQLFLRPTSSRTHDQQVYILKEVI